ncbi:hypothetical protein V8E51_011318 [Hyaloscypha variabilis]
MFAATGRCQAGWRLETGRGRGRKLLVLVLVFLLDGSGSSWFAFQLQPATESDFAATVEGVGGEYETRGSTRTAVCTVAPPRVLTPLRPGGHPSQLRE